MAIREIMGKTFWQLILVYTLIVISISLGFFSQYALYFNLFSLIISIFGISLLTKEERQNKPIINTKLHIILFILAIILIILFRFLPYINNSVPLGYDAGLYKYGIEHGLENKDKWILNGGMEPGFLYMMKSFTLMLSINIILKHLFIFFIILLGFAIYMFSKEYFDKDTAIITLLIYSLSAVQFKVFTYMYYKNIIALSLIFFAFYFLHKEKYKFFVLSGILIGAIHRPSFYIFGLAYFLFAITHPYNNKSYNFKLLRKNVLIGIIILAGVALFYLGDFKPAILSVISPVVGSLATPGESPGTFISFHEYQFSILFYLPLAILGFFYLIKNRKFSIFFFYTSLLAVIIYFQFFFFNRFIIFLDIGLIILAGKGFNIILNEKRKLALLILVLLLLSGALLNYSEAKTAKPTIPEPIFNSIEQIQVPENSYIISISSAFSPFLQGWTPNRIIAPGLFDYDIWHSEERWQLFWIDLNASELERYYNEDIYLFTNKDLNRSCYKFSSQNLYKWVC